VKRIVLILLLVAFLAGVVFIVWTAAGLPPVRFFLRYGLDPYCAPTGRVLTVEGHEFVEIGPGVFRMGSMYWAGGDALGRVCARLGLPWGDQPRATQEIPVHLVEFRKGFWIARHEVTNAQHERIDPDHERSEYSRGDDDPVVVVSWEDARSYCAWLAERSGLATRLPSEAEWECACRAGSATEYCFGDDVELLTAYAWFNENCEGRAHPVGGKEPNTWGLHDVHGNAWEWCEDWWHPSYDGAPQRGEAWIRSEPPFELRVIRGGSFLHEFEAQGEHRSANRTAKYTWQRDADLGFRPCLSTPKD
jgi:formylglycine-generating enzyme required for sulfatase activity